MKELVQNNDIYRIATFLNQVLLDSNNLFRTYTFSTKILFQKRYQGDIILSIIIIIIIIIIISLVFHLRVFQNSYFLEKANFSEKQYSALSNLSGEPIFRRGLDLTFHSRHFFRRATFQNILF